MSFRQKIRNSFQTMNVLKLGEICPQGHNYNQNQ